MKNLLTPLLGLCVAFLVNSHAAAQDIDPAPAPAQGWINIVLVVVLCLAIFAISVKRTKRYHQVI